MYGPRANDARITTQEVRRNNRAKACWALLRDGPLTTRQLAAHIGVSAATSNSLVRELINEHLAHGRKSRATGYGKPPTEFRLNSAAGHVVALRIGEEFLSASLTDLGGTPIDVVTRRTTYDHEASDVVALIERLRCSRGAATPITIGHVTAGLGRMGGPSVFAVRKARLADALGASLTCGFSVEADVAFLAAAQQHTEHQDFLVIAPPPRSDMAAVIAGREVAEWPGSADLVPKGHDDLVHLVVYACRRINFGLVLIRGDEGRADAAAETARYLRTALRSRMAVPPRIEVADRLGQQILRGATTAALAALRGGLFGHRSHQWSP